MSSPAARAADARPEPVDPSAPAVSSRDGGRPARTRRPRRRRPRSREAGESPPVPTEDLPPVDDAELDAIAERLPALSLRDEHRLGRRLDTVRRTRDTTARGRAAAGIAATVEAAEQRMAARRAAVPDDPLPGGAAGQRPPGGHRRRDPRPPGRDRRRRDRLREDHPDPEDLPRARPRRARTDRAHPAAPARRAHRRRPHRRGAGHRAGRRRRLEGALHRPRRREHAGQADDRRHPARRADRRPDAPPVRHADHRRGPRAQPQHRLHPRLPDASCCPAGPTSRSSSPRRRSTPSGSPSTSRRRWARRCRSSRCPAAATPSRSATGRSSTRTTPTPIPTATSSTPSATPWPSCSARATATSSCSCPASARSATPPTRWASATSATPRSSRCTPGCPRPSSTGCSRPHPGRRVVLATNVAETSLTVPGIRYVVDPGTARISRYSRRLKVQRLPIEKVSQASANQRAGRCGRVADGICIRLYSEDDFDARPEFTEPEILRTNLASVVLQMISLDLGRAHRVPVRRAAGPARGRRRARAAAGAGRARGRPARSPPSGRALAALPVDPRLGRMLVEADRTGCLREVLVIAAALSVQDPRERPAEQRQAADAKHARFAGEWTAAGATLDAAGSDFLAFLNLWRYVGRAARGAVRQPVPAAAARGVPALPAHPRVAGPARPAARRPPATPGMTLERHRRRPRPHPHRGAVRAALAGRAARRRPERGDRNKSPNTGREYLGARGAKFMIFPGSPLARKPPRWVMAAELVETSRLFARTVARIKPGVDRAAGRAPGQAHATPSRTGRASAPPPSPPSASRCTASRSSSAARVDFGRIDPELSRELFIRHALVEGDWDTRHRFFHANRELLDDVEELEHRARRRDLVVDEETLVAFYDERIPADVVSGPALRLAGGRGPRAGSRTCSTSPRRCCAPRRPRPSTAPPTPTTSRRAGSRCRCRTRSSPARARDGVTVDVPVAALHQVDPTPFTWQVPGLREELVTALIKTLPKQLRRHFAPAPDHARAVLARLQAGARNRCSTAWSASWAGCAASTSRARRGSWTGCPST